MIVFDSFAPTWAELRACLERAEFETEIDSNDSLRFYALDGALLSLHHDKADRGAFEGWPPNRIPDKYDCFSLDYKGRVGLNALVALFSGFEFLAELGMSRGGSLMVMSTREITARLAVDPTWFWEEEW
jgi:hypothetical protein